MIVDGVRHLSRGVSRSRATELGEPFAEGAHDWARWPPLP